MVSSSSASPSTSLLSASSATPSSMVGTESTKQIAWQTPVYLVAALGTVTRYPRPRVVILRPPDPLSPTPFPPYLLSLLVFVAVVASIVWLVWNDSCTSSTPRRGKMEPVGTDSTFYFPAGKVLLGHCRVSDPTLLVSVCHSSPSVPRFVRTHYIIRCHRQRRRSSEECATTSSRDSGLPFYTLDRPPPLH
jgi:hypothetical protein